MQDEPRTFNYDDPGILEHTVDEVEYRIDVGKQGTVLALSHRPVDTWDWEFLCEVKWDGKRLSARRLEYDLLQELGRALGESIEDD